MSATIIYMIAIFATLFVVFAILVFAEMLRNRKILSDENLRKFVHIGVGVFVSTWPFYLSILTIEIFCLAFLAVVLASRYFKIFRSIHSIDRKTWGDILFPIGIGLTVMLAVEPWIFTVAMLHLSLADGIAAVVGKKYKRTRTYTLLNQTKSTTGTLAFWLVSVLIVGALILVQYQNLASVALPLIIWLPLITTLIENAAPQGTDNLLVPFTVTVLLNTMFLYGSLVAMV